MKHFRSTKKHPLITEEDISQIKKIEIQTYPDEVERIEEMDSVGKMLFFCHALTLEQVYCVVTEQWFIVVVSHCNCYDILEFNSASGTCGNIFFVIDYILKNFKHKPFIADCRESTSYQLVSLYEKHGRIQILNDHVRVLKGENKHHLKFKILKKHRKSIRGRFGVNQRSLR